MRKIRELFEKLKYRERLLAATALSALTLAMMYLIVIGDLKTIRSLREETAGIEIQTQTLQEKLTEANSQQISETRKSPLWRFRQENRGLASLLRSLTAAEERRADFTVKKITSEKVERTETFEKTTLQLDVEAPFNSLGTFLEELEKSGLMTRVESVKITRREKELRLCQARIMLNTYVWRDQ